MQIKSNISLADYTTMRLGGPAEGLLEITSTADLDNFFQTNQRPYYVIGGGSNTLATDDGFDGIILHIGIKGVDKVSEDSQSALYRVGAGESWDGFVEMMCRQNLSGIEALSAIPGTVGAAPVQNIGAYGQEVSSVIESLQAFDTKTKQLVTLSNADCQFSYRSSIFRTSDYRRYIITAVIFRLQKNHLEPPFYKAIDNYMSEHHINDTSPMSIRAVVSDIRKHKLPDPNILPNSGSFFKNSIVDQAVYQQLKSLYDDLVGYEMPENRYKISSGWLIEKCGLKGQVIDGIRVHDKNALVLINLSARSFDDLARARDTIIAAVRDQFGISLEQEPLMLSTSSKNDV